MSNQKYSGEVNPDHPVIDKCPDGTVRMYFHELPPILLKCPYIITPEDDDEDDVETQNLASPPSSDP